MAENDNTERLQATVKELEERLLYVEEERSVLVKQKENLTGELEQSIKERSESDVKLFQLSEDLRELQYTRTFLDELVREKELLEGRILTLTKESSEERARGRHQAEATQLLREEIENLREDVQKKEGERKLAVLAFEEQGQVVHEKIQLFASRIRDLQSKLSKAVHEKEASSSDLNSMRRNLEQLKTDNGGMVSLMSTMEKKLNEFSQKEARMDELARSCKESAENALLERDQAVANETYLRSELSRLRDVRVKEYDERERQHLASVSTAREGHEREIQVKEKTIASLRAENEHLRVSCDRAHRDRESLEVRLQQLSATVETERKVVSETCRGLEQRIRAAEDAHAKSESELERVRRDGRSELLALERTQREVARRERASEERRVRAEGEATALEEKLELLQDAKDKVDREKAALSSERDSLAAALKRSEAVETEAPALRAQLEELRQKKLVNEARLADAEARSKEFKEAARQEAEFLRNDKQRQEGLLVSQLRSEQEQVKLWAEKHHELSVASSELRTEVTEMQAGYADAVHRAELLEVAVNESQQRIMELSIQLAESGGKEQQHIREQSRLKGEIAKLRFSSPSPLSSGKSPDHPVAL